MKEKLISILESFGYEVFLQGSIQSVDDYPESFFTFWNFETPEAAFYDDNAGRAVWGFWVYFYSTNPMLVEKIPDAAKSLLKQNGWIPQGKPNDISVDKPSHTGRFFTVYGFEEYEEEEE